ncbi:MAG: hypothetical protein LBL45_07885 [Treponema sp.]|jgi:hypothetical protein|nr:hypothetical protein [Treponema sp.]
MKKLLFKLAVCSVSGALLFASCDAFGPPDETPGGKDVAEGLTLTYDLNYADIGEPPAKITGKQAGDTVRVTGRSDEQGALLFDRDGYAFAGWNTKRDGTGAAYFPDGWETATGYAINELGERIRTPGAPLSGKGDVTFGDGDITLYAQWSEFSIVLREDAQAVFLTWHTDRVLSRETITIPDRINTLPIVGSGGWLLNGLYLAKNLVIESSQFTKLDAHTFPNLQQLEILEMPYVREIDSSLHSCLSLQSITLGTDVVFKVNGTIITLDNIDDLHYRYDFPLSYAFVKYYLDPDGGNKRAGTYSSYYTGINGDWSIVSPFEGLYGYTGVLEGEGDADAQWRLRIQGKNWWIYDKATENSLLQGTFTFVNGATGTATRNDGTEFTFDYNAAQKKLAALNIEWAYIDLNN